MSLRFGCSTQWHLNRLILSRAFSSRASGRAGAVPKISAKVDLQKLEDNFEEYLTIVKDRKVTGVDAKLVYDLGIEKKKVISELNQLREKRNLIAGKGKQGRPTPEMIQEGRELKEAINQVEQNLADIDASLDASALKLPNWIDPEAPRPSVVPRDGSVELEENGEGLVVAKSMSTAIPTFDGFEPKDHIQLGEELDIVDFISPVSTSGQKFASLKNQGVLLELALVQWVLHFLSSEGFTTFMTPDLVYSSLLEGCGFQPRGDSSHVYRVHNDSEGHRDLDLCLVGTSEVPLAGFMAGKHIKLPNEELPKRFAGFGHCFRAEAGSSGAATKGLYRLHQFSKVEMFVFSHPNESAAELLRLRSIQERICEELGLHWRTIDMFPHELGNPAYRKFDVQVFMPSRAGFGEVASISNCTDFQARRLDIRYSHRDTNDRGFVHTLNGTAIAIPRIVLSILENFQQADGSVKVPSCLLPFFGKDKISKL